MQQDSGVLQHSLQNHTTRLVKICLCASVLKPLLSQNETQTCAINWPGKYNQTIPGATWKSALELMYRDYDVSITIDIHRTDIVDDNPPSRSAIKALISTSAADSPVAALDWPPSLTICLYSLVYASMSSEGACKCAICQHPLGWSSRYWYNKGGPKDFHVTAF